MFQVSFRDLESFAEQVVDFFKKRIKIFVGSEVGNTADIGEDTLQIVELTPKERMTIDQNTFVQKRGEFLIGREEELNTMMQFIRESTREDEDETKKVLFIVSEPGNGKSSLVANYVTKLKEVKQRQISLKFGHSIHTRYKESCLKIYY